MPIGQLMLMTTTIDTKPEKLSGSYVGPIFPEAPKSSTAREQLRNIGIDSYRRPGHGWVHEDIARRDVEALMNSLSSTERDNIKKLAKILRDNGSLPIDSPILGVLQ